MVPSDESTTWCHVPSLTASGEVIGATVVVPNWPRSLPSMPTYSTGTPRVGVVPNALS